MARGPTYRVPFRRRREGKTNYKRRIALLKSEKPRMVVRMTNKRVIVQIIDYKTDHDETIAHVTKKHLEKMGWKKSKDRSTAYLCGYFAAKRAIEKGVKEAVLDMGLNTPIKGGRVYSALKGAVDAGLKIPHSEDVYPKEEWIKEALEFVKG